MPRTPPSSDRKQPSYRDELTAILRRRDPEALRGFLSQNAARFGDRSQVEDVSQRDADEMLELMHRMIVAMPDLEDLHRASREWLFKHGVDAYGESGPRRN